MFSSRRIITMGGDKFKDEHSLVFGGTDEYLDTGATFNSTFQGDHSISVWVKPTDGQPSTTNILCGSKNSSQEDFMYLGILNTGKVRYYFEANDEDDLIDSGSAVFTDGQNDWTHLVITAKKDASSSNGFKLYVNGVLNTEANSNAISDSYWGQFTTDQNLSIGAYNNNGTDSLHYTGGMSDFAIYNKVLSANEVKQIYNGREPFNHKESSFSSNLVSWYRMGDGTLDKHNISGTHDALLICDEVNPTLGSELITGFTNGSSYPLDTFVTSGRNVSSAIETSGNWGGFASNQLNVTAGEVYKLSFNLTYNSGTRTMRTRIANGATGSNATIAIGDIYRNINQQGLHETYFIATSTDSTSHLQMGTWQEADVINFSVTDVSLKKVNGNAAVMINMEGTDVTGDSPHV